MPERGASGYVELHARSAFSFLEGACMPEAMPQQAATLVLPGLRSLTAMGCTGRLVSTPPPRNSGCARMSEPRCRLMLSTNKYSRPHGSRTRSPAARCTCRCSASHRAATVTCRCSSRLQARAADQGRWHRTLRKVEQHSEGLVCLTAGDEGPLAAALARGGMEEGGGR